MLLMCSVSKIYSHQVWINRMKYSFVFCGKKKCLSLYLSLWRFLDGTSSHRVARYMSFVDLLFLEIVKMCRKFGIYVLSDIFRIISNLVFLLSPQALVDLRYQVSQAQLKRDEAERELRDLGTKTARLREQAAQVSHTPRLERGF